MPRVLLVLTIAVWMAIAGSAVAARPPPPPPGHIAFEAGPNSPVTVGTRPKGIAVGDLDDDGNLDFVTANTGSDTYRPVYGNGFGGFTPGIPEDTGDGPESIVLADFDGDTRLDIAVANRNADTVWVMLQESPGEFNQLEPIPSGGDAPVAIAAGRLDANGSVDLVVANSGLTPARSPRPPCSSTTTGRGSARPPARRWRRPPQSACCWTTSTRTGNSTSLTRADS